MSVTSTGEWLCMFLVLAIVPFVIKTTALHPLFICVEHRHLDLPLFEYCWLYRWPDKQRICPRREDTVNIDSENDLQLVKEPRHSYLHFMTLFVWQGHSQHKPGFSTDAWPKPYQCDIKLMRHFRLLEVKEQKKDKYSCQTLQVGTCIIKIRKYKRVTITITKVAHIFRLYYENAYCGQSYRRKGKDKSL